MSEIKFSDGMPVRERRSSTSIYPEELLDKKCGGCMRCQPRKRKGETGYRCTTQPYTKDISPEDNANTERCNQIPQNVFQTKQFVYRIYLLR